MRFAITFTFSILVVFSSLFAGDITENETFEIGDVSKRELSSSRVIPRLSRTAPERDNILGERFIAGDTWYDFQTNGSLGKMIELDAEGGIHITWMDGYDDSLETGVRHQKYNYFNAEDNWTFEDGGPIDDYDRGGYGCIFLTTEDDPRIIAFCHGKIDGEWRGICAIDWALGVGAFQSVPLPVFPEQIAYFPQGVMSPEGLIHVAMQRRDRNMICYALGVLDDDGIPVFGDNPENVGETHRTNLRIAQSPRSERAAIVWDASRVGVPQPENYPGGGYALNNDLMIAWTDDGDEWNFDDPFNITRNVPPDPELEGDAAYGDTLRPYASMDVIFDSDDYIHVIFDARGFWENPEGGEETPVEGITIDASYLFHWSEETDIISPVADGWFTHREVDEDGEEIRWPTAGGWQSNVCAPSMAFDDNGDLYCVFNYYPLDDYSQENYCNGEIAVTVSEDYGETWTVPTMITETTTHQAEVGESESEKYPTLASRIDDFLHISYELDTEPGSPISDHTERLEYPTLCQWMYHRVPVEDIQREEIWEDNLPDWHTVYVGIEEDAANEPPSEMQILSAYPNPFNSSMKVRFNVSNGNEVSLALYNLNGQRVRTLAQGKMTAGEHEIVLSGNDLSAGIYLLKLGSFVLSDVRKVVYLK